MLATKLAMTVSRMRREMSNSEFVYWQAYYARRAQREQMASLLAKAPGRRR
jgi:hypothetical protein